MENKWGQYELDKFQSETLEKTNEVLNNNQSGAVIATPGSGKSVMIATAALSNSQREDKPKIIIIQPTYDLLMQNLQALENAGLADTNTTVSVYADKTKRPKTESGFTPKNRDLEGQIILTTPGAIKANWDKEDIGQKLEDMSKEGKVILLADEAHRMGAQETQKICKTIGDHDNNAIFYSATLFRADDEDPLEYFGTKTQDAIINHVDYQEVVNSGRIVPPQYQLERDGFAEKNIEAYTKMEETFQKWIELGKTPEQASERALNRLFGPDADEGDKKLGEVVSQNIAEIWKKHASNKNLTIIHCDGVNAAKVFAEQIAKTEFDKGNGKAFPRVGYIDNDGVINYNEGVQQNEDTSRKSRETFLTKARNLDYDVLVNCRVLGEGTDIPCADMTLITNREMSLSPYIQATGRTSRSYQNPETQEKKTSHTIIDIGRSTENFYAWMEHIKDGQTEIIPHHFMKLDHSAWKNLDQQMKLDPKLRETMESSYPALKEISERNDQKPTDNIIKFVPKTKTATERTEEINPNAIKEKDLPKNCRPLDYLRVTDRIEACITRIEDKSTKNGVNTMKGFIIDVTPISKSGMEFEKKYVCIHTKSNNPNLFSSHITSDHTDAKNFLALCGMNKENEQDPKTTENLRWTKYQPERSQRLHETKFMEKVKNGDIKIIKDPHAIWNIDRKNIMEDNVCSYLSLPHNVESLQNQMTRAIATELFGPKSIKARIDDKKKFIPPEKVIVDDAHKWDRQRLILLGMYCHMTGKNDIKTYSEESKNAVESIGKNIKAEYKPLEKADITQLRRLYKGIKDDLICVGKNNEEESKQNLLNKIESTSQMIKKPEQRVA